MTTVIERRLIAKGEDVFNSPIKRHTFTGVREADEMLNDLDNYPHAFVIACIMDRRIKAEKAWIIPFRIKERLGSFSVEVLSKLSPDNIRKLMSKPEPLHMYWDVMSVNIFAAVKQIVDQYDGNAAAIWMNRPSSADVVYRFLEFRGIGPKIATMATNILVRAFKIPLSDYASVDVSADIHVRRVIWRLNMCPQSATTEQIIYKARAIRPDFPGIIDQPLYEIGRDWCRPTKPRCNLCYMNDVCPSAEATV